MLRMKKSVLIMLLIAALVLGGGISYAVTEWVLVDESQPTTSNMTEERYEEMLNELSDSVQLPKVVQAFNQIQSNYIEEVSDQDLVEGAISGMLSSLGDPYSEYLDVETMEAFNEQIEASFEGIGAEVSMIDGVVTIVSPLKGSPAEKAGLRPNDQVITIKGEPTEGLDLLEAVAKIRGEKGTDVNIEVRRQNSEQLIPFTITRDTIPLETVYSAGVEQNDEMIGYIEITNFSETTAVDFKEALTTFEAEGIDGLVIDVRGNPGGLLDVVQEILREFIPSDRPYMQVEDGNGEKERFFSNTETAKSYPVTVLIDEGSASASEILAVSLQETIDANVVGQTSFGKGTVQTTLDMGDGSSLKLTILNWLSAEGTSIHEVGVEPTIEVKQPDYYYSSPIVLEETVKVDSVSTQVRFMQEMLKGLGYDINRTDGYFSNETAITLEAFQNEQGLSVTGELNQETAERLQSEIIQRIRDGKGDQQKTEAINVTVQQAQLND
ncbi:carboxyl-terminal processing protease [Halolactibacillus halophilus]|uniref:C-terminal processing peptidase n=3 Tax=Halolactibacillus halophilus TaxID=306540 RepID=A0A1I5PIB9_9BACI|nr:carboxyl-terminal processing protease [Halolactibacillus halophilus]